MSASPGPGRETRFPVLRRWFADGRRALLGWSAGMIAVALLYLPLFPSMRSPELTNLLDSLPPELVRTLGYDDIASGAGYTQATMFGLLGFVLLTVAGVSWGAALVGGAEESGRLELTLAHGVGRVQYALESAAALLLRLVVLGAVVLVVVAVLNGPAQLDLEPGHIVAGTVAWVSLGALSATAALAAGAASGRRSWGVGAGTGVAVVGYVLQALAKNSEHLRALRLFSPYHWAFGEAPLAHGADLAGLALLWLGSAVLLAVTASALARRDVLG